MKALTMALNIAEIIFYTAVIAYIIKRWQE